jgi:GTP-binding nuclear protein Ran
MDSNTFKVVLVGDGGVGKSSLRDRWVANTWDPRYRATLGVEVFPLCLQTNYGPIKFNIWDCAGQEKFSGLKDGYYIGAKGGLLVFDVTSKMSYKNLSIWNKDVQRTCEGIPMDSAP